MGFQSAESPWSLPECRRPSRRSAIAALRQRFMLRQTLRTVPIMFSIALVQPSGRRTECGYFLTLKVARTKPAEGSRSTSMFQ
jgi:hypothetical protein